MPVVKTFATKVGAIDVPDGKRRVHDHPIPRMGGLAIFLGFIISVVLFVDITREVRGILLGAVLIVACGAIDDVVNLRAIIKLLVQIAAAVIAVAHGVVIEVFSNPILFSSRELLFLGWLAIPVTILWIVGITNSVNLIDGLDGLAVGVSTIASVTMVRRGAARERGERGAAARGAHGRVRGLHALQPQPGQDFHGDTGALLLGYVLSTVSVEGMFKTYAPRDLRRAHTGALPAALRHRLRLLPQAAARPEPHAPRPRPPAPPPHRHGPEPEAGRRDTLLALGHTRPVRRRARHDRTVRTILIVVAALAAVAIGLFISKTLKGHHYHPPVDPTLSGVEEEHNIHHHEPKEEPHD